MCLCNPLPSFFTPDRIKYKNKTASRHKAMRRRYPRYHSCSPQGGALAGRVQPIALTRRNGQSYSLAVSYCRLGRDTAGTPVMRLHRPRTLCDILSPGFFVIAVQLVLYHISMGLSRHKTKFFRPQLPFLTISAISGRSYACPFSFT